MIKLAIIHTTITTVDPLKSLALELIPDCDVINFVDDSILPQLLMNDGNLVQVQERLVAYTRFAQEVGSNLILEACSSVGELVPLMQSAVNIPVVRIDNAMADAAIKLSGNIGVAATLPTTLAPTARLLSAKSKKAGKSIKLQSVLVEDAFECLSKGDRDGHDRLLIKALNALAARVELVVLAQASMARVVPQLSVDVQHKFLSSSRLAVEEVWQVAEKLRDCRSKKAD